MSSNNKVKELTVKFTDLKEECIETTDLKDGDKGQRLAFVNYNHPTLGSNNKLMIQLPWFELETFGIPNDNKDFYKTPKDRCFLKVPLNSENPDIADLISKCSAWDKYFSDVVATKLFKKNSKRMKYSPIFKPLRIVEEDSDDDKKKPEKKKYPSYPFMILKFKLKKNSDSIATKIYNSKVVDGERKREEITDIETIDDLAKVVKWRSRVRPIISIAKVWAHPLTKAEPMWGITLKVIKLEVEQSENSGDNQLYSDYMNADTFLDDNNTTSVSASASAKESNNSQPKVQQKVQQLKDDDDDDDDDESDEKTKPKQKQEVTKVNTVNNKTIVEVESDDDDDDDDDEQVKTVVTKPPEVVKPVENKQQPKQSVKVTKGKTLKASP